MSCRYTFYGGIRGPSNRFDQSKQFGTSATMASSTTPTPWNHPPPLVDNFRWWDTIFLNLPCPPKSNEPPNSHGRSYLVAPCHGKTHEVLVPTFGFPSSCLDVSSAKTFAGKGTLKTSAMFPPQPTISLPQSLGLHHFRHHHL